MAALRTLARQHLDRLPPAHHPTLCDLCGLPQPGFVEGANLAPLFADPQRRWKDAVFSWRRPMYHDLHKDYHEARGMRTERYRLTSYEDENSQPLFTELFDHQTEPNETRNLAIYPANHALVDVLRQQLNRGWRQCALDLAAQLD